MRGLSLFLSAVLLCTACTATGRGRAVEGAAIGAAAGAVGGLVTAAIFGGDAGRAAARGAAWGASTGAVSGAITGDMEENARVQQQEMAARQRDAAEIERLRREIGDDNLAGLEALTHCKYPVALAYAQTAGQSSNRDFALASDWLQALVYADQGDRKKTEALYPKLLSSHDEIHAAAQVDSTLSDLLRGLRDIRARYGLPTTCGA